MLYPARLIVTVLPLCQNRTQCVSKLGHLGCIISRQPFLMFLLLKNVSLSVSKVVTVLPSLGIEFLRTLEANYVNFFQPSVTPQMSALIVSLVQSTAPALTVSLAVLMVST